MMSLPAVGIRRNALLRFALALALTALLLTLALRYPAPQVIDVGTPGDAYFLANFYPAETDSGASVRWSAPGARLLLPASAQGPLALTMRLHGAPFVQPEDLNLTLVRAGRAVGACGTKTGWRIYRFLLAPGGRDGLIGGQTALDLVIPSVSPGPADPRPLGVVLDRAEVIALGPMPLGPALERALLLTWALAMITAGVGTLERSTIRPPTAAVIGAGAALWAWRDPGGFAWALPNPPLWLLVAGTLIMLLVDLVQATPERDQPSDVISARFLPVGVLLAGHLALLLPLPWRGLGALVVLGLPGWLAARALFPDEGDPLTQGFLGLCGALTVAPLLTLALQAIPGPLPGWLLLLTTDLLSAALMGAAPQTSLLSGFGGESANMQQKNLIFVIAIGIALRLTLLGGAEFQGDEARAMLLAVGVAQGNDGILLTHTKGPVEALLPAGPLILAGAGAEWVARLPFTLAGAGLLLGVVAIARAMWPDAPHRNTTIATVAVALLASDGFALGFSRIVQYQSVVLLMSAGAFWCGWRFYAGAERPARYLLAAAVLLAVGLLAHYDAAMVAPALAWLVVAGGWRRGWRWREWLMGLGAPTLVGAALLSSFYVPYVTSASFGATAEYLAGRAGQGRVGGPPFNNLPLYMSIMSFYNVPPLVPILAVALLASLCLLIFTRADLVPSPPAPLPHGERGVSASGRFRLPLSRSGRGGWGVRYPLALWFAVPFVAESFLIAEPRTHFYSAHPAAALIIGYGVAWLMGRKPAFVIPLRLGGILWLAISLGYAQLLYLRPFPEYQRTFPAARPAILRASYGDQLPKAGYFGFPHSDGWKAAAELYRAGVIAGSYDTNQNRWLVGWYLRNAPRCAKNPNYYLIAEAEATRYFPPGYHLLGEITLGPTRALAIYSRAQVTGPPQIFSGEELAAAFDARPVELFPAAAILADSSDCR